ncbi:dapper homolog 1 isoform X2 [Vulpes vulpes]|uniref:Dapper homolog 1 isoform X2 n=1 Tax=Vulpes vulpes TaxID=9627 RepID=A0ABM5ASJ0_VULVU
MKPSAAGPARELEPQAPGRGEQRAAEPEGRWREKGEADTERQRTRERQEATLAGLAELEYLRQRQELLNCLRRRDAGLLNQLQELDKQISDLRLDVEKTSEEHLETDSRPSSGFYELSDGASGSLSNSSNSVFSECLSSCHSSTCFCSPLEATLTISDGCPKSADLIGWLESKEGHCEDQASGAVCHSSSTSQFNSLGVIADVNPKYQCDLVSKNGNDVYRYPSPLHAVAVQSPMFLLCLTGSPLREEERLGNHASDICVGSELDAMKTDTSLPSPGSLWSAPHPSSSKRMDGYILSLVQKKTHPVRTNKPRTSVSADPTKGLLRNGSVCVRVTGGVSQGNSGNLKNSKQVLLPSGGIPSLDNGTFSPLKQWSKESKAEPLESKRLLSPPEACSPGAATELPSKHLPRNAKPAAQDHARCPTAATGESPRDGVQVPAASPKESPGRGPAPPQENRVVQPLRKVSQKGGLQPAPAAAPSAAAPSAAPAAAPSAAPAAPPSSAFAPEERPALDFKSEGSSSQSLEEGPPARAPSAPGLQAAAARPHRGTRTPAAPRSAPRHRGAQGLHAPDGALPPAREKSRAAGKKCRFPDDVDTNRRLRKASSRGRKGGAGQPEAGAACRGLGAGQRAAGARAHGHGHGRETLVAKPKHKRAESRRWRSAAEVSLEEALRRSRRRREHVGLFPAAVPLPYSSPYAYVASDSEYSAECESLFHSTVLDTSEDERSNYTTNCFGDSESSVSDGDFAGDSTSSSDSEESGGLIWSQFVQTLPIQAVAAPDLHSNPTKTFVKIKASHNLKKKILRFRSGSLKLMTTV